MTTDTDRFVRAMKGLCPGDVITNLVCCEENKDLKVLVLEITDGAIQLSVKSGELSITRDPDGPFRWDEMEQYLVKKDGKIPAHIGHGVSVLKAEGLREVALYDRLPRYRRRRLDLKEADFIQFFKDEPSVPLILNALVDDDSQDSLAKMEACMNYAFHGRLDPISSREMMRLLAAICLITNSLRPTTVGVSLVVMNKEDVDKLSGLS